ncbi:MAG TPA: hypothetical protein VHS09_07425, partial [Polyangiaceae bacterium]|nr:hypothetical protein [Polyangiaceae bacterium]
MLAAVNRRTTLASVLAAAPVAAVACALAGCPAAATTQAYTPITGILIRSSALVAGFGCGTGDDQVYRYGAFLSYREDDAGDHGAAVYSGVFDCYSDGLFSNLPADEAGSLSFDLTVVAWNEASFPSALSCDPDNLGGGGFTTCPGDSPGVLVSNEGKPTWITTCTATQQSGVSVLAVCAPLAPAGSAGVGDGGDVDGSEGDAGAIAAPGQAVVVDTHGFVRGDGGTLVCGVDFQSVRATY